LLETIWRTATRPELATDTLIAYLSTLVLICEGKLINHILDATSDATCEQRSPIGQQNGPPRHSETCLAALYWLRCIGRHQGCGVQLSHNRDDRIQRRTNHFAEAKALPTRPWSGRD
jgi:hypothetical protein